jgi:hypothetical protein
MTLNTKNVKFKAITLPLTKVARWMEIIDPLQKNVRESGSYDRPEMVESIREIGMTDPIWVVKADAGSVSNNLREYIPLKGFSRREAMETLNNQYPQGFEGRKFDTIAVQVVDVTDPLTRLILKLDHGDHRGLSRRELFNSFEQMHSLQATEKDIAVRLAGSLEANYPPDKKLPERPSLNLPDGSIKPAETFKKEYEAFATARHKHYKGVIQQYKLMCQAPALLREVCMAKLDGVKKWPTNEELRDGMKIYDDEIAADKTGMLSKENPGPAFKKWFDDTASVKKAAEEDGTIRGKTTAMMNASQVRDVLKQLVDPRLRRLIQILLRQVPVTNLAVLDKVTQETPLTGEGKAIIAGMQEVTPPPAEETETKTEDSKEEINV